MVERKKEADKEKEGIEGLLIDTNTHTQMHMRICIVHIHIYTPPTINGNAEMYTKLGADCGRVRLPHTTG